MLSPLLFSLFIDTIMSTPLVLTRFSGSTLEPTSEPIVIYPDHVYQKDFHNKQPPAIEPTRRTPSLKRKGKPTFISIPPACQDFIPKEEEDTYSPWSYDEEAGSGLLWDDVNKTIYTADSVKRRPSPPTHWLPTIQSPLIPVFVLFSHAYDNNLFVCLYIVFAFFQWKSSFYSIPCVQSRKNCS